MRGGVFFWVETDEFAVSLVIVSNEGEERNVFPWSGKGAWMEAGGVLRSWEGEKETLEKSEARTGLSGVLDLGDDVWLC